MADDVDSDLGPAEALAAKHKTEKKELQAKIQAMKKGIPKGDKKKNKEIKAQIAILESELEVKHEKEIKELESSAENRDGEAAPTTENDASNLVTEAAPVRVSKAQKKRDKKAQKVKEQAEIAAQAEKDYVNTKRYEEEEKIRNLLKDLKLEVKPMVSDGNCMYYAIEDQIKNLSNITHHSTLELRKLTSDFMLAHADDFMPFLTNTNTGDCFTVEEFQQYCRDVAETQAWGGQLELRALSHVLKTPIHVMQADIPTVIIGDEYTGPPVILTYHHHELGLGEHYNSVKPLSNDGADDR